MVEQWYNSRTASKSPSRSSLRRSRFELLLPQYWWRLRSASWRNLQDQLPKLLFHLDTLLRFTQGSGQFIFCMTISLRASSPGRSRGGTGKRKESLQLRLWNLNMCIEKADAKGWLVEITLIMTSLPLACIFQFLFTFALVSASRWLVEIWQLSRRGATGELEVEFKFRRRSCKLSFHFPTTSRKFGHAPDGVDAGIWTWALTSVRGECSHHCATLAPHPLESIFVPSFLSYFKTLSIGPVLGGGTHDLPLCGQAFYRLRVSCRG